MPPMEIERCRFQVVWMPDGHIFAIGGSNADGDATNSVETLRCEWASDGETSENWRQCSPMLKKRSDFSAVVLHGDVVLVAGGVSCAVELFNPPPAAGDQCDLGQWTNLEPMHSSTCFWSLFCPCFAVLSGGVVYIFGTFRFLPLKTFLKD